MDYTSLILLGCGQGPGEMGQSLRDSYLQEGIEADGHPVGQHLLNDRLCSERQTGKPRHEQDRQLLPAKV